MHASARNKFFRRGKCAQGSQTSVPARSMSGQQLTHKRAESAVDAARASAERCVVHARRAVPAVLEVAVVGGARSEEVPGVEREGADLDAHGALHSGGRGVAHELAVVRIVRFDLARVRANPLQREQKKRGDRGAEEWANERRER
jgi:hypothetical protein